MNDDKSVLNVMADRLNYREKLSAADWAAVLSLPATVRRMERNQVIVREHDKPTHTCVMLAGYSVRYKLTGRGSRQILGIHMKGDLIDLQNSLLAKADHGVQMLTSGNIAMIPREAIIALAAERPAVGRAMWIDTLVEASIAREAIMNVGRRDGRTRVAHLLCEFSLRLKLAGLGEEDDYELPMTQEQIGDATGMTSVHVNRVIRSLEADQLIERRSARAIHIGDWRKLAEVGDFDSNYLHLHDEEPALR